MPADSSRLSRAPGLNTYDDAEDGLIVFNPSTDRVHHLNATAAVVFELCNGSTATADLAGLVAQLFSVTEPPREAVEEVLRQLVEEGVLVEAPADVSG